MDNTIETQTPQQLEAEGGVSYQRGDYFEAVNIFSAAEEGYKSMGDDVKAAEMANNRCVAFLQDNQPKMAFEAVDATVAVFQNAGAQRRHAMALGNRAAALDALGQLEDALADYEASAAILKDIGEDELRLDVLKSISTLQLRTGRSLQALASMQAGVDGIEKPKLRHRILRRLLNLPSRLLNK